MGMSSCKRFPNPFTNQKVLAEVGGERLYLHELTPIFTPDMTAEDSIKVQKSYVDQWVKKQLKVQEAEEMFRSSQEDIDRLVEEYRNSLLTHKVDQYYVDKELDTLFTDKQIADYYLNHKSEFVLDKIILNDEPFYRIMFRIKSGASESLPSVKTQFLSIEFRLSAPARHNPKGALLL